MSRQINSNLEKAIKASTKKYGNAMSNFANEIEEKDIISYSTGSKLLDLAISSGERAGLPEGRLIELFGPQSSGKCLTKDNYILTAEGNKTIEQLFEENGTPVVNTTKTVLAEIPLINRDGEVENTQALTFNGKRKLIEFTTKTGIKQKSTFNHPVLVLEDNYFVWKRTDDLNIGDYIVSRRGDGVFGTNDSFNEDSAFIMGLLVADGYFGENRISFTNNEEKLIELVSNYLKDVSGSEVKHYKDERNNGTLTIHLNNKNYVESFYEKNNIKKGSARDKVVPKAIMSAPKEVQLSFLSGYFEPESYIHETKGVEVISASNELLKQIQLMLRNIGVVSTLSKKTVKGYEENWYGRLGIYGENADLLLEQLSFQTELKKEQKEIFVNRGALSTSQNNDRVPNIDKLVHSYIRSIAPDARRNKVNLDDIRLGHETGREKVLRILDLNLPGDVYLEKQIRHLISDEFFYDEVVELKELAPEPTFDVVMPKTHSFIANGLVNHNTTISLLAIAERQKIENAKAEADPSYEKKVCVFLDAEFALDLELARQYGVDTNELLIIRPDEAEDGMDILDSYIRTGGVGLAVVDSVSALVPAIVEQSSYQQKHMAVLARFMSQVSTRMSGVAWKNRTTIIFINQVREAVGKWSPTGSAPEITPGGHALKFHSSLRIRVRRGETIGPRENPEGHVMIVQIVKNKIDKPFRTADVKLIYGLGIDVVEELGEAAIAMGVVHQGGAWFKIIDKETGELLSFDGEEANFQGRNRLFDAIEESEELRNYIEEAVFNAEQEPRDTSEKED